MGLIRFLQVSHASTAADVNFFSGATGENDVEHFGFHEAPRDATQPRRARLNPGHRKIRLEIPGNRLLA